MINDAMGYKLNKIAQRWEGKSHVYVDVFGGQEVIDNKQGDGA
jgi:hypothetical protein